MSDELMSCEAADFPSADSPAAKKPVRRQCQADESLVIQQYNHKFTDLIVDSDSLRGVVF